jgi:hypothetical protein
MGGGKRGIRDCAVWRAAWASVGNRRVELRAIAKRRRFFAVPSLFFVRIDNKADKLASDPTNRGLASNSRAEERRQSRPFTHDWREDGRHIRGQNWLGIKMSARGIG